MAVIGVVTFFIGVALMWYSWESHKTQSAPTPIKTATSYLTARPAGG